MLDYDGKWLSLEVQVVVKYQVIYSMCCLFIIYMADEKVVYLLLS
jgi:hypothetical protein